MRRKQTDEFAKQTGAQSEFRAEQTECRRYRIIRPMMALTFAEDRQIAKRLPAGEILELVGTDEDQRFVIVATKAERAQVLKADLAERAKVTALFLHGSNESSAWRNGTRDARPSLRPGPGEADLLT